MPQGLEAFLLTYAFLGVVIGTAAGAAAAWFSWPPLRCFAVSLVAAVTAGMVLDLAAALDVEGALAAILLAPLVAALPVGAGFVVGHRFVRQRRAP